MHYFKNIILKKIIMLFKKEVCKMVKVSAFTMNSTKKFTKVQIPVI